MGMAYYLVRDAMPTGYAAVPEGQCGPSNFGGSLPGLPTYVALVSIGASLRVNFDAPANSGTSDEPLTY